MITKIPFDKKLQSETKEHLQSPSVISIHTGNEKDKIPGIKINCKKNNIKRTRRAKLVTRKLNSFYMQNTIHFNFYSDQRRFTVNIKLLHSQNYSMLTQFLICYIYFNITVHIMGSHTT